MITDQLRVGGAVVFWSASATSDRAQIVAGFESLGIGHLAPEPKTPLAALRDALGHTFHGNGYLVQPLKNKKENGYEVLEVERGITANDYRQILSGRVVEHAGCVKVALHPPSPTVLNAYQASLDYVTAGAVGKALVAVVDYLQGVPLRPSGGVYWIPERAIETWGKVAAAIESAAVKDTESNVYVMSNVMTADTIRAVRDAISLDVKTQVKTIHEEITAGDIGRFALASRENRLTKLRGRISEYESILGEIMPALHEMTKSCKDAAMTARLKATAEVFEPATATT